MLLVRTMLFFIPVVLFCAGIEYYNKTRIGNNIIAKLKLIDDYSDSLNTLIVGNSHGRNGLISAEFKGVCVNAAIGGSSVFYSKEVFKRALEKNESGTLKNLVLTISYQTLFKDLHDESTEDKRYEFYHYLGADLDLPRSFDLRRYSIIHTISFHAAMENVWNDLRSNPREVYENGGYTPTSRRVDSSAASGMAKERIAIHHGLMSSESRFLEESLTDLEDILKLARQYNISVYIITTPVIPEYYALEEEPFKSFSNRLAGIADRFNVEYVDYNKRGILKKHEYYKDPDHLNKWGAAIFTQEVKKDFDL